MRAQNSHPANGSNRGFSQDITREDFLKRAAAASAAVSVAGFGGLGLAGEAHGQLPVIDPLLEDQLAGVGEATPVRAILTYEAKPTAAQVRQVRQTGASVHEFEVLPMLGILATGEQIRRMPSLEGVASVYADRQLDLFLDESRPLVGADRVKRQLGFSGEGVGVAVIDSGIDGLYSQDVRFPERTVQNVKIVGDNLFTGETVTLENLPNTDTTSGHGTHVSGVVGGDGSASEGRYTGVAPGADLVGVGVGDGPFVLFALQGFDYVLANRRTYNIQVINNSYGTTGEFDPDEPMNVATKQAHDAGITVVFASGNSGPENDTLNPFSVAPWVIGVAAGAKDGKTLAEFSSRGRPGSDLYRPALTAPGVDIVSTRASTGVGTGLPAAPDDAGNIPPELLPFYTTLSGTSFSSPHVAGAVALMKQANPALTPDEAKQSLMQTATPMDSAVHEAGAGYLDAFGAVQAVQSTTAAAAGS